MKRGRADHLLAPVGDRALVRRLLLVQGNACASCGRPMRLDRNCRAADSASVDHVVPRARGGRHVGNQILMHRRCNVAKADRPPTAHELRVLDRVNAGLEAAAGSGAEERNTEPYRTPSDRPADLGRATKGREAGRTASPSSAPLLPPPQVAVARIPKGIQPVA